VLLFPYMYYKILALGFSVLIASALFGATTSAADSTGYCRAGKDAIVDLPWPGGYGQIRPMTDGFKASTVSFRIRIPNDVPDSVLRKTASDFSTLGFMKVAEKSGAQRTDQMTSLSQVPCDFNHNPIITSIGDTSPGLYYGISKTLPTNSIASSGIVLRPGQTYYLNVSHDLTGYGPMPETLAGSTVTNRTTCASQFGGCDILVDFMIPGGGAGYPYRTPSSFSAVDSNQPLFPLLACHIIYGVSNLGSAQMSTSNMDLFQNANGSVTAASCPGPQAVQAVINQQALQSTGSVSSSPSAGSASTNLTNLVASNSAEATAIIQALAKKEANNGVVVSVGPNGVSTTIDGVTFSASTAIELAAKYYQYLQSAQGVSSGAPAGGTNAGNTLATSLSVNLAPGDYNPTDQVRLLQAFLNSEVAATLTLNGFFNDQTQVGVIKLQNKYASQTYQKAGLTTATGFVGQYTRDLINSKLGAAPSGSGSGSSGAVVTNYCTGADQIINVPWPASGQVRPATTGFKDQTIAFKITVPSTFSPALNINHLGFMRIAEVANSPVVGREVTVSRNPCDFQSGNYFISGLQTNDTAPGVNYSVNNPNGFVPAGGQFNLQSGDTIYFNVRNISGSGAKSCSFASCNVLFDFATPNRY
jgi:hypothetical protein